jgi:hypothetical protein
MPDSCSEYSDDGLDYLSGHMHGHMDGHMLDVSTSTHPTDGEAAAAAAAAAGAAAASYNPHVGLSPRSANSARSDTVRLTTPSPVLRNSSKRFIAGSLEEPLLAVNQADRSASGDLLATATQPVLAAAALDVQHEDLGAAAVAEEHAAAGAAAAAPRGAAEDADDDVFLEAAAAATAGLPPAAPSSRTLRKFKTFAEGSRVTVVVPPSDASNGGVATPKWHHLSPRALSDSSALTPERSLRRCTSVASGGSIFAAASRGATQHVMPLVQLLQVRAGIAANTVIVLQQHAVCVVVFPVAVLLFTFHPPPVASTRHLWLRA